MDATSKPNQPGLFWGLLRTALLLCAPSRQFINKWKNVLLFLRMRRNPSVLEAWRRFFDPAFYLRAYPDVFQSGVDACIHFLVCGGSEFRRPSAEFDAGGYLDAYPDITRSGINPLLHFVLFGAAEGRHIVLPLAPVAVQSLPDKEDDPVVIHNAWLGDLPLVSVVIPSFNYGRVVEQAIRSVLDQTFQNFEVIVVEGGSTDPDSVEQVRRIETRGLPKVRFVYREGRHLVGDNRNFGIGLARGRYICCLDADDLLSPVYLEVAVFLSEAFGYDVVYPSLQGFGDSTMRWIVGDASFPAILDYNQVTTAALYRKSAWAHVGGYRDWGLGEQYVFEDWDFWIRLLGHGFLPRSIREPLLLYRVHGSGLTATSDCGLDRQRKALREANRDLWAEQAGSRKTNHRRIIGPLENLLAQGDDEDGGGSRPGFLIALPYVTIGGAEKLFGAISEYLAGCGHRVLITTSLILSAAMPEHSRIFAQLTPHVYHLRRLFHDDVNSRGFMKYLIRRYRVGTLLLAGCEFTYSLLPEFEREFPEMGIVDQLFNDTVHIHRNREYAQYIDATVVPSAALSESLVERFQAELNKVHVIPHGVKIPEAPNGAGSRAKKVMVAFLGRFSPEKGPDLFVQIVQRLSSRPDLSFLMIGDGPERGAILSLITRYRLEDRLLSPGFVDDVEPYLRESDIVVVPSRLDGMPLTVLEAQAREKVVVASRVGSLPRMIHHEESGFLCEPGNIDDFCACISRLADDPDLRRRIGKAARRSAAEKHSETQMFAQYQEIFDRVSQPADLKSRRTGAA